MKKCMLFVLVLALLLASIPALSLAEEAHERPAIVAHKANGIVVDGDLSDWDLTSPAVVDQQAQVVRHCFTKEGNPYWKGADWLSAKFYLAWDEDYLYFAVDAIVEEAMGAIEMLPVDGMDNVILWISTNPESDPNRWTYDTWDWMIYFVMNYDETLAYGEPMNTAIDRSAVAKDKHLRFTSQGMDGGENVLPTYEPAVTLTTTGYIFECRFSWADLSGETANTGVKKCTIEKYAPKAGDELLCNFAITDIGYPCPGTDYIPVMVWSVSDQLGQDQLDYIKAYPALWGMVTLAD